MAATRGELIPIVGARRACALTGRSRASHYRRPDLVGDRRALRRIGTENRCKDARAARQTVVVDVNGLHLSDHLAVSRLKYLRQRSMRNPRWHDATYLTKFTERRYLRWAVGTPLEDHRQEVERAIAAYAAAARSKDPSSTDRWMDVREAVDRLIAEAERLAGHRIKPRRT